MNFIDHIYVITLNESINRQNNFKEKNKNLDFTFFKVLKDKENPMRGCFNSHMNVIKEAISKNYKKIIIFEDDAEPIYDFQTINKVINNSLKQLKNEKWEYLLLGYLPIRLSKFKENVSKVNCAYDAHAYIVNLENIKIREWEGINADSYFCSNINVGKLIIQKGFEGIFATIPMLYSQQLNESTISDFDLLQKYFFNFYHDYSNVTNISMNTNTIILGIFSIIWIFLLLLLLINSKTVYLIIISIIFFSIICIYDFFIVNF